MVFNKIAPVGFKNEEDIKEGFLDWRFMVGGSLFDLYLREGFLKRFLEDIMKGLS